MTCQIRGAARGDDPHTLKWRPMRAFQASACASRPHRARKGVTMGHNVARRYAHSGARRSGLARPEHATFRHPLDAKRCRAGLQRQAGTNRRPNAGRWPTASRLRGGDGCGADSITAGRQWARGRRIRSRTAARRPDSLAGPGVVRRALLPFCQARRRFIAPIPPPIDARPHENRRFPRDLLRLLGRRFCGTVVAFAGVRVAECNGA